MKKKHYLGLFLLAPVALFLIGPRAEPDLTIDETNLPQDLDRYLREKESRFPDITPGVEKTIVWNDPVSKARTPVSVVYIHGFSATRQEVNPLCDLVAESLGANLFYTRLAGHGRKGKALGKATVNNWINDAVEAVAIGRRLGDRVVLIGTSTGGTLSTWITTKQELDRDVLANVLISPNFSPKDKGAQVALWPWGKQIIRSTVGKLRKWTPRNEMQAKYWTTTYPVNAIVTMMALVDAVEEVDLAQIDTPTLILYSEKDQVISVPKIKEKYPQFGSKLKRLVAIETGESEGNHVIAGDIVAPSKTTDVAAEITSFVRAAEKAAVVVE